MYYRSLFLEEQYNTPRSKHWLLHSGLVASTSKSVIRCYDVELSLYDRGATHVLRVFDLKVGFSRVAIKLACYFGSVLSYL